MSDLHNEIKEELKAIAPTLQALEKSDPKDIPDGYFDQLPDQVWKKIKTAENAQKEKSGTVVRYLRSNVVAIAASLLLVAAVVFLLKPSINSPEENLISEDMYLSYLLQQPEEIDDELLISLMMEEDLESLAFSADDELLDYYLEENIYELDDSIFEDIF